MLIYSSLVVAGYLLGSIASAILVCRAMGLDDPRKIGSGNPGATNVLRVHGKTAALLTLAGDVLKGVPAILVLHYLDAGEAFIAAAGLAAFLGHLYPVYFGFRGGKGVATLIGVLLASHWILGTVFIGTWLVMAFLFRYSSLSAMVAAIVTPAYGFLFLGMPYLSGSCALMSAALLWRHRSNMKKLLSGEEDKIGTDKK